MKSCCFRTTASKPARLQVRWNEEVLTDDGFWTNQGLAPLQLNILVAHSYRQVCEGQVAHFLSSALHGKSVAVEDFLRLPADPNAQTRYFDAAEEESTCWQSALCLAATAGHATVVQSLIEAFADLDSQDSWGATPLFGPALQGHLDVAKMLLLASASVDGAPTPPWPYDTPLMAAAERGHSEMVGLLLAAGADKEGTHSMLIGKSSPDCLTYGAFVLELSNPAGSRESTQWWDASVAGDFCRSHGSREAAAVRRPCRTCYHMVPHMVLGHRWMGWRRVLWSKDSGLVRWCSSWLRVESLHQSLQFCVLSVVFQILRVEGSEVGGLRVSTESAGASS